MSVTKPTEILEKHARELLAAIVDSSDDAIISKTLDGIITSWNKSAERLFGYSADEAIGRPVTMLIPPDQLDEEPKILGRIRQGERIDHYETVRRRKDGSHLNISLTISPLRTPDGHIFGASKIARDITERARLDGIQQRLAAIVENSEDAIISKDLNGIITSWNNGAERLFGYTAGEAIGKSVLMLIPAGNTNEEPKILERIRRGERIEHYETIRQKRDGGLLNISLTVSPLMSSDGRVVGASKIARDISERKHHDQQLLLLVREMRHRVKNTIATVQSIASQTLTEITPEQRRVFAGRLEALAGAHDLLTLANWRRANLPDLVNKALAPFVATYGQRITVECPDFSVAPHAALTLSLGLHELATNAIKYGALSNDSGTVRVVWKEAVEGSGQLSWEESGGPPVTPPIRKGFGTRLLRRALGTTSAVTLDYRPAGLLFIVELNREAMTEAAP